MASGGEPMPPTGGRCGPWASAAPEVIRVSPRQTILRNMPGTIAGSFHRVAGSRDTSPSWNMSKVGAGATLAWLASKASLAGVYAGAGLAIMASGDIRLRLPEAG